MKAPESGPDALPLRKLGGVETGMVRPKLKLDAGLRSAESRLGAGGFRAEIGLITERVGSTGLLIGSFIPPNGDLRKSQLRSVVLRPFTAELFPRCSPGGTAPNGAGARPGLKKGFAGVVRPNWDKVSGRVPQPNRGAGFKPSMIPGSCVSLKRSGLEPVRVPSRISRSSASRWSMELELFGPLNRREFSFDASK
ncbi:MAG: hypothetical protein AB9869_07445 [Verrucomicrobiia bacterium]